MSESYSINLYFCPLTIKACDSQASELLKSWLPEDELIKVDRYIKQEAKAQGLMVRGYLRGILSRHSDLLPNEWCFEYGDKGKPRLTDAQFEQTGIDFNLSHSGAWLLVGICVPKTANNKLDAVEFGVDIERCRSTTNIHSILSHYFSEPEKRALLGLPEALQRDRFFDLWALKESYIKAKGLGLALSLKSFAFDFSTAVKRSLPLQLGQSDSPQAVIKPVSIELNSQIQLNLLNDNQIDEPVLGQTSEDGISAAKNWQCVLGHLDEDYRFAISVGGCDKLNLNAKQMNLNELLTVYR
ncbi:4'-phosphopantetheinyl transferase family protein [Shewanella halifaxensis]|uniref:4'-phosphopantetheinyl transferase family protein n=1 Tax=Shewanella halifaxensis TaxID=271098 RepID=UPI000D59BB97|nr:4'-phosphopantetheinyl transferase superfamily protein [Shewanella halifaxensis]